eukprot:765801-Hanusia_phi.AAC.3
MCRSTRFARHIDQQEGVDPSQKFWTEVGGKRGTAGGDLEWLPGRLRGEEPDCHLDPRHGVLEAERLAGGCADVDGASRCACLFAQPLDPPSVFTLLSNVFPTINIWSPQATAMVTDTYQ